MSADWKRFHLRVEAPSPSAKNGPIPPTFLRIKLPYPSNLIDVISIRCPWLVFGCKNAIESRKGEEAEGKGRSSIRAFSSLQTASMETVPFAQNLALTFFYSFLALRPASLQLETCNFVLTCICTCGVLLSREI